MGGVFSVLGSAAQGTASAVEAAAQGFGETAVETEKVSHLKLDKASLFLYIIFISNLKCSTFECYVGDGKYGQ